MGLSLCWEVFPFLIHLVMEPQASGPLFVFANLSENENPVQTGLVKKGIFFFSQLI